MNRNIYIYALDLYVNAFLHRPRCIARIVIIEIVERALCHVLHVFFTSDKVINKRCCHRKQIDLIYVDGISFTCNVEAEYKISDTPPARLIGCHQQTNGS